MARIDLTLDGVSVASPVDWKGINVLMTWDNASAQANITTEKLCTCSRCSASRL